MDKDRIKLTLEGTISLSTFAEAINYFNDLVISLSEEVSQSAGIIWEIADLKYGSATAEIRGSSSDIEEIEKVTQAYQVVSTALMENRIIPYSDDVRNAAVKLTSVIGGGVTAIKTEVAGGKAFVTNPIFVVAETAGKSFAFGSVTGQVETLSSRGKLRFILYDHVLDNAVNCYFQTNQHEMMRGIWGKRVVVTGMVFRDPDNGRAISVKDITDVQIISEDVIGGHRSARGIFSWKDFDETSEHAIRRIRKNGF